MAEVPQLQQPPSPAAAQTAGCVPAAAAAGAAGDLPPLVAIDGSPLSAEELRAFAQMTQMLVSTMESGKLLTEHKDDQKNHHGHAAAELLRTDHRMRAFVSDARCVRRYLQANRYAVPKAYDALLNTVFWRATEVPKSLDQSSDYSDCLRTRFMEWSGRDREGRPSLWITSRNADLKIKRAHRMQFLVSALEKGVTLMKPEHGGAEGMEQWNMIIDETDKDFAHMDNKFLSQVAPIVFSHYVERLRHCYLINPGVLTQAVLAMMKLFMDDRTKSKIHSVYGKPEGNGAVMPVKKLLDQFGAENVPVRYGGTLRVPTQEEYAAWFASIPSA